ncbi:MAG: CHASE3 domain-containing protein [Planctomycetaceae bacterium]|nr:CHASE3 domain-containing protein [Planctomycetaceae bacterium]
MPRSLSIVPPKPYLNWLNFLFAVATISVVVLWLVSDRTAREAALTSEDIYHNFRIRHEVYSLLGAIQDAETGQRGFLITGDDNYLEHYHVGINKCDEHLAALRRYMEQFEVAEDRLQQLQTLILERRADLEHGLEERRAGDEVEAFDRARETVVTDRGRMLMNQIRSLVTEMLATRDSRLAELEMEAQNHRTEHAVDIALGLFLTLGTFLAAAVFTNLERIGRLRAASKLKTEQARLIAIVDSSMDAVVAVDHEAHIVMLNPIAEELFQRRERDVLGEPFQILVPEALRSVCTTHFQDFAFSRETRRRLMDGNVIHGLKADNTEFPAEASVSRAIIEGQPLFTVILKDVTERETGRTRMREQAAILSRIRDAIHVRDLDGRIQFWNDGAQKLYGWKASEALGRIGGELLQAASREQEAGILAALLRDGGWIGEREIRTRSGVPLIIESRRSLIVDELQRPVSQLVIDIDVTEEKKRQQVERRSQRLESIGTLASGIAHDLNNVLTPITMGVKLLKRPLGDEQRSSLIETITASAERGAGMVRQLLSFAGGTAGPREVLDIADLIDETRSILVHTLPKTISVAVSVPDSLWPVFGDVTELSQVLMNLAINARDAMPQGGTLTFAAENVLMSGQESENTGLRDGRYVKVSVIDTGHGISPEVIERIFDPFFTTKEQGKGTGLGLATCMGIVTSHGGNMAVRSEPGQKTEFSLYLPSQQTPTTQHPPVAPSTLPEGRGQTILLIDDEESILQVARAILESHGYLVLESTNGQTAIETFASNIRGIDAVVVDMMMPGVGGAEVMKEIRRLRSDILIVATSGLRKPEPGRQTIDGSDAFLPKPYTDSQLLQVLEEVFHSGSDPKFDQHR